MSPRAKKGSGKKTPAPARPRQTLLLDAYVDKLGAGEPVPPPKVAAREKPDRPPPPPEPRPLGEAAPAVAARPSAQVQTGIYPGTPYDDYDGWDRMNHSILHLFNRSPLHARTEMLVPSEPTKAMKFGHAAHCVILEPDRFEADFIQSPVFNRRSPKGREAFQAFCQAQRGRTVLLPEEYDRCRALAAAAKAHPLLRRIMAKRGVNEVGLAWTDPGTEVALKARPDRLGLYVDDWPTIIDVKTAVDAGPWAFAASVHRYSYHQQAALYLDGAEALQSVQGDRRYVFVVIEPELPHAIAVYELAVEAIEQGRQEYQRNLRTLVRCRETGHWPGYTEEEAGQVGLPSYALRPISED